MLQAAPFGLHLATAAACRLETATEDRPLPVPSGSCHREQCKTPDQTCHVRRMEASDGLGLPGHLARAHRCAATTHLHAQGDIDDPSMQILQLEQARATRTATFQRPQQRRPPTARLVVLHRRLHHRLDEIGRRSHQRRAAPHQGRLPSTRPSTSVSDPCAGEVTHQPGLRPQWVSPRH